MLGKLLKDLRVRAGIAQTEAARSVGVSRAAVGAWEAGSYPPTPKHLAALAALYRADENTELRLWRLTAASEELAEVTA